jgi:4a-hydroxytetrahydrobiopterin dehydratase
MELRYVKLSDSEVEEALGSLAGWAVEDGQLAKTFGFESYLAGSAFASAVAQVAEELNHHPDILIGYQKVRVSMNTHDVGGLSPYDFELARRIDAIS